MANTLTFTTPARQRDLRPIEVDFCGEQFTVHQPKQATLYFAQPVTADTVSDADRAMAILQFIDGCFPPDQRKRFFDRARDRHDPVDLTATVELLAGLLERWGNWTEHHQPDPVVVTARPVPPDPEPIRIEHPGFDISVDAYPPKDIILRIAEASLAATATLGQQAWSMGLFLDACLDPADALMISHRMRSQNDDLDLDHIAEIVTELLETWDQTQQGNRAQRRAAARARA